ncbi:MAG: adenylate/guanylate cyclase domain-containing protein [Treponema sp.]|nr:adenylate/guanylate cyclase domain-containing protein [Treponema sp.]MCL2271804.1 adenylate/guanylate cyclase domain-containing protein [Treponema sp.]
MSRKIKYGKKFSALIIAVLVFVVISGLHLLGVFHFLENKSYDFRVRFWAGTINSRPSDEIVLIVVDQDSLDWAQRERGWGWPWPRQAYAEIVDYMNLSNAKSIAFDVIFSEPSIYRNARQDEIIDNMINSLETAQNAIADGQRREAGALFYSIIENLNNLSARQDDAAFEKASHDFGRVVQAVVFSSQTGSESVWPGYDKPILSPQNFGSLLDRYSVGENEKGQFPIPSLSRSAAVLGSVTGTSDSDGIYRRLKPFTLFDGKAVPGLSAASFLVAGKGNQIHYNKKTKSIEWDDITIPVNKNGYALLRYRGDLDRYIPYRAMDILLSAEAINNGERAESGKFFTPVGTSWAMYTPQNFNDAYVFFGFYAQGLFDIFSSPIDSVYPGVGCHVTMLDNMIKGDFIRESEEWMNMLLLLSVIIVIVSLTMFSHRIPLTLGGTILLISIVIVGSFAAYDRGGLWVPMVTFLAGLLASFITVTLYNYATEGSQKRFIKSAFSQYLSPKVIEQIIADPSQLKLGGEKREMTAIFTDIRAFSTISEALGDPAKLVELLNFYLTKMSNIVLDNQGTIDKYEGDAIIAFFGAPVRFDNHASLACRAAIRMKKAEREVNREALANGLITREVMEALAAKKIISGADDTHPLFTRIGLNTGDMVVGNMGTPNKMDYTIMGNAVNLAARLEGVNKQYDTGGILISEYTRKNINMEEFIIRPLNKVRVVGINTPIRLYELLDIAGEASPELTDMVKNWYQAFKFYEKKDFASAKNIFESIYVNNNNDKAAKKYLDRCFKYINSAPDEKIWDQGVDNLTEK